MPAHHHSRRNPREFGYALFLVLWLYDFITAVAFHFDLSDGFISIWLMTLISEAGFTRADTCAAAVGVVFHIAPVLVWLRARNDMPDFVEWLVNLVQAKDELLSDFLVGSHALSRQVSPADFGLGLLSGVALTVIIASALPPCGLAVWTPNLVSLHEKLLELILGAVAIPLLWPSR